MMDLAAQNGIKVVIAEFITAAPEWAFRKYPHAHFRASDGSALGSSIGGSSATGGFPGVCLDNPDVRAARRNFSQRWWSITAIIRLCSATICRTKIPTAAR